MKRQKNNHVILKVSHSEKEILKEMISSERANVKVFGLPNRHQQIKYEKLLDGLVMKFT